MTTARLTADANACTGHGRCYNTAPNLLSDDDEGYVTLRGSSMEVATDDITIAQRAADACPERALTLTRQ